ncbi:MAG TPA: hypothetical protein VK999_08215 [Methylotenera sp.]|nr:hypothetical protein [Methylotenera sp.]
MLKFFLLMMVTVGAVQAEECTQSPEHLAATYQFEKLTSGNSDKHILTLWRNGKRLAHENPEKRMTAIWEQGVDGRLRLVRSFDADNRGIEYQPSEVKVDDTEAYWAQLNHLIAPAHFQSWPVIKSSGKGCDLVQTYQLKSEHETTQITWQPAVKLVISLSQKTDNHNIEWTLRKVIHDKKLIKRAFENWDGYFMTDYADIGDNESDPFLLKMMNLGHIEHGAAGFYDSKGNSIDGGHGHQH